MKALANWELIQKWEVQADKANEMKARYAQKIEDAKAVVREATVKYEMILRQEFEGQDVAAEKEKALSDIEKAKAAVQVAEEEENKAFKYANEHLHGKITIHDLVKDFRSNVAPQIQKEELQPIIDRADKALFEYYEALAEFYQKRETVRHTVEWLNERGRKAKPYAGSTQNPMNVRYMPKPTNKVLKQVEDYRYVPKGYAAAELTLSNTK
ncbi:hypothetical protein [Bacillus sp. FSL L8-0152]|uniref:hypothetical protein n=1 Tax=Bacillus sp. FSL L8-0152 TaxID=2921516 RepID=UPI0030F6796B